MLSCTDSMKFCLSLSLIVYPNPPLHMSVFLGCILCLHKADGSTYWLANTGVSMHGSPQGNVAYGFFLASPAVPCISCASYLSGLLDGREVAIQLLFCGVLLPGFVQDSAQHSCIVPI